MTRWEVRNRNNDVLSTHDTEAAAWARVTKDHGAARKSLNKSGLHGGIAVEQFCERYVVKVTTTTLEVESECSP